MLGSETDGPMYSWMLLGAAKITVAMHGGTAGNEKPHRGRRWYRETNDSTRVARTVRSRETRSMVVPNPLTVCFHKL